MTKISIQLPTKCSKNRGRNSQILSTRDYPERHFCHQDCNGPRASPDSQRSRGKLIKMTRVPTQHYAKNPVHADNRLQWTHSIHLLPLPKWQEPTNSMMQDCSLLHNPIKGGTFSTRRTIILEPCTNIICTYATSPSKDSLMGERCWWIIKKNMPDKTKFQPGWQLVWVH